MRLSLAILAYGATAVVALVRSEFPADHGRAAMLEREPGLEAAFDCLVDSFAADPRWGLGSLWVVSELTAVDDGTPTYATIETFPTVWRVQRGGDADGHRLLINRFNDWDAGPTLADSCAGSAD